MIAHETGTSFSTFSRRQFFERAAGAGFASLATATFPGEEPRAKKPAARSRVVLVRDPAALGPDHKPQPEKIRAMVERGILRLTGASDSARAWKELVSPRDVVGLKVNCLGGPTLCTHPALARAVADSLAAAGVPAGQLVIWDRTDVELERCGFTLNKAAAGPRCLGTPAFDKESVQAGGIGTRLSTLATRDTTAAINLALLKSHTTAGFSGALKNELGCIENPVKFHRDNCRAAADVCALEAVARKRRLVICDALRPLYDKGPTDFPACRWVYGGLIFATDPVAADWVGRAILEEKRKEAAGGKYWPLLPPPVHLDRAVELRLGAAGFEAIEVIEA